jgi:hypothetical protein
MPDRDDKIVLKWYHVRRVRLTREYSGGILAGFGCGVAIAASLVHIDAIREYWGLIGIFGLAVSTIGAYMALYAQDRYTQH